MNGNPIFSNLLRNQYPDEITIKPITIEKNIISDNQISLQNNQDSNSLDVSICDAPFICNNEKFLVDTINNKIISFYSTFKYLKFKYHIKNTRRNQIDCLIKRIKTKFHNSLHLALKQCLNTYIYRLPQFFITNVKIDFNKLNLNKTVEEIYKEYKLLPSLEEMLEKKLYRKDQKEFVIVLLSSKLKNVYKAYLLSELYKIHINSIKSKEGVNFAKLYDFVSIYVLDYFLYNKGNKIRQNGKDKTHNIGNNNNKNEKEAVDNNKKSNSLNKDIFIKKRQITKKDKLFKIKKY